jgi:geranylgeranyl pyrophosphate synthase
MRYGGLNVAGSYRLKLPKRLAPTARHHLANSMAIMGGDVTMGFVLNQVLDSDFSAELKLKALQRIEKMIFEVAGGEVLDVLIPTFDLASVTEDRLLQTYRYKTASYSFEAPMQLGAILAGADASLQTAMSEVALPLGVAFQLVDDLLGVFGNETEIGKSVLSDLREGKRTLLIVKGLELADEKGQQVIGKAMGNRRAGYSDLGEVRTILSSCGAKTYVEELAKAKVNLATVSISKLGLSETVEAELRRLSLLSIQHHA